MTNIFKKGTLYTVYVNNPLLNIPQDGNDWTILEDQGMWPMTYYSEQDALEAYPYTKLGLIDTDPPNVPQETLGEQAVIEYKSVGDFETGSELLLVFARLVAEYNESKATEKKCYLNGFYGASVLIKPELKDQLLAIYGNKKITELENLPE